jgi:quercetin dioxygenase-like cupin family protein
MKTGTNVTVAAVVALLAGAGAVRAQDPVKVDAAHYNVILDNPSVRVLRITYPAGSKSVMHEHPDAMVFMLSGGKMSFATPDGKTQEQESEKDTAMFTPAGTHLPSNVGKTTMDAILVEYKAAQPGTATLPASPPGRQVKTLAESPRGDAMMVTLAPDFHEPAGTKHDYDQVVIALGPADVSLAIDGKPAKTTWKRGDVSFIGRGVAHESKVTGGKPVNVAIIAVK